MTQKGTEWAAAFRKSVPTLPRWATPEGEASNFVFRFFQISAYPAQGHVGDLLLGFFLPGAVYSLPATRYSKLATSYVARILFGAHASLTPERILAALVLRFGLYRWLRTIEVFTKIIDP